MGNKQATSENNIHEAIDMQRLTQIDINTNSKSNNETDNERSILELDNFTCLDIGFDTKNSHKDF
jgi:hypothetical protein